jgi:hypothetical protein
MPPTPSCHASNIDLDAPPFELSPDHLAVLAELPIAEAWRFCRRKRRDLITPDLGTFLRAVTRMGFVAYADLLDAAMQTDAELEAWRRAVRFRPC